TPGTVASKAYQRAIDALAPDRAVVARTCPLFVPLAEEGWTDGEVPRLVADRYLTPFRDEGIGTLVLGCTHYPLLHEAIAAALPGVTLVDSARATAAVVEETLRERGWLRTGGEARHQAFVTDLPQSFHRVAERFLGRPLAHLEQVDVAV
ncbi:MAG: hypothetical protein RL199_1726, partial [Pseudomonadota bacterium]